MLLSQPARLYSASFPQTPTYPIAVLKGAKDAKLATAWVEFVQSTAVRKVLVADGFLSP